VDLDNTCHRSSHQQRDKGILVTCSQGAAAAGMLFSIHRIHRCTRHTNSSR
jgi:hypothetical protein